MATQLSHLYDILPEFEADPISLLNQLNELYQLSIKGYQTEKVTQRGGVVQVTEVDPRNALNCVKAKYRILELAHKHRVNEDQPVQLSLLPALGIDDDKTRSK